MSNMDLFWQTIKVIAVMVAAVFYSLLAVGMAVMAVAG